MIFSALRLVHVELFSMFFSSRRQKIPAESKPEDHMYTVYIDIYATVYVHLD